MGGDNVVFQTTQWTEVVAAGAEADPEKHRAMSVLMQAYWKPVYWYIRRKGHDVDTAKDLTQGFFETVFLERNLPGKAEPKRGRFRSFLLTSLEHYMISRHRAAHRKKRRPDKLFSLDALDAPVAPDVSAETAEEMFHRQWARDVIGRVLDELEQECRNTSKDLHWAVFRERVLGPIVDNRSSRPLKELCRQLGIESETRASNMVVTVKRRFQAIMRQHVRHGVSSDSEVDQEIADLIGILSKR